jgi:DNA helicase II / ATP-dependent DNA helicase PcrA
MFDAVLVDEYQDVNTVQADIVRLLAPEGSRLTCVGDDAQAI